MVSAENLESLVLYSCRRHTPSLARFDGELWQREPGWILSTKFPLIPTSVICFWVLIDFTHAHFCHVHQSCKVFFNIFQSFICANTYRNGANNKYIPLIAQRNPHSYQVIQSRLDLQFMLVISFDLCVVLLQMSEKQNDGLGVCQLFSDTWNAFFARHVSTHTMARG